MSRKIFGYVLFLLTTFLVPAVFFAQEKAEETKKVAEAAGIDKQINDAFKPIADAWDALIFTPIFGVPFVLILLVFGATFFTLVFGFVNIRRFPLALQVVRGKYDDVEEGAAPVETDNLNVVDGNIVDTIRVEGVQGEVSHFQALATAVSGTVGAWKYRWCSGRNCGWWTWCDILDDSLWNTWDVN